MSRNRPIPFVVIALALLCLASVEAPDWTSSLAHGGQSVPISAWFDDGRTRGFLVVGTRDDGFTSKVYRMWRVRVGDLDADGDDELVLGVWSDVRRHDEPQPHRTVWVLDWDGARLREAWRGSALARPLVDFGVSNEKDAARLVATERVESGCVLTTYRWNGFGFVGESSKPTRCTGERR